MPVVGRLVSNRLNDIVIGDISGGMFLCFGYELIGVSESTFAPIDISPHCIIDPVQPWLARGLYFLDAGGAQDVTA